MDICCLFGLVNISLMVKLLIKEKKLCVAYGIDRIECENIIDKMKKAKNDLLWE